MVLRSMGVSNSKSKQKVVAQDIDMWAETESVKLADAEGELTFKS